MGQTHSTLTGDELHIAKSNVSTGTPVGNQSAGVIGELYWDSTNNILYVAEATGTANWIKATSESDEWTELLDTPSSISAGLVVQGNSGGTALEFGQALDTTDSPTFLSAVLSGAVSNVSLDLTSTTGALRISRLTTTQRDALTPLQGMTIFNTTTLQIEDYSGAAWVGATEADEWTELSDTPSSISAGLSVQGNSGGTALEFGQALDTTDSPTFTQVTLGSTGLVVGSSTPFSDSAGVLTLQNVDALDTATETTIETAIDTLANLTSIQGQSISLSGSLTVEAASTINQDLTTDASPTFTGTITGPSGTWDAGGVDIAASDSYAVSGTDILSDAAGVLTLSNVDALDVTTEITIETAIDTLVNLTSIQGQTISLSGALTVEAASTINQDLTTDASPTFATITSTGLGTFGSVRVTGTFLDSSGDAGTSGQLLSSTVTGTNWIDETGGGNVSNTGTPLDNQIAVWTGSTTIEGVSGLTFDGSNLATTGLIRTGDGTVSLPAYAFTSDTDTGVYLDATGILAFATSGEDILKLQSTSPTQLSNATITNGFDVDEEVPFVTYGVESPVTSLVALYIASGGSESVNINVGSSNGPVNIGQVNATGFGTIHVGTGGTSVGAISVGLQTGLNAPNPDGNVLILGATTSFTKTKMTFRSPANSLDFEIGLNNTAVDSGSAFFDNVGGTEMRLQNSAGTAISISSLDIILGGDVDMLGDLFIGDATDHATIAVNTGYDLSTINFDFISFSVLSEETNGQGIAFNSDGSKMYIVGQGNDTVFEYDLSTNFNVSTAVFNSISLSVTSQDNTPRALEFNTAGTKMFLLGASNDSIFQYTLTTGFDLSTASYDSVSFSVTSQETGPTGLTFTEDGTKFYIVGSNDVVYQYSLSTAFDMATASYDSVSFDATAQDTNFREVKLDTDGGKMFLLGAATESLYQYSLSTAFDISTATYDSVSFSVTAEEETPRCFTFNSTGTAIFVLGTTNDSVFQYTISPSLSIIPTAELTAIIGSFSVKTDNADTVSVLNLTTSGTNGGTTSIFVGDQDPNANVTGAGGDIYVKDNGALSNLFFSKEATTGTEWQPVSILPTTVDQLFSTAEYEALGTASVITTGAVTRSLRFHASVTSSTKHTLTSQDSELQFIDPTEGNQMIYTGTTTFITAAAGGDVTSRNAALIAGVSGTQLFDYAGEGKLAGVDFIEIVQSSNLAQWNLGTISRVSTGEVGPIVKFKDTNIITTTDPLILDSCVIVEITSCLFDDTASTGSGGPLFSIKDTSYKEGRAVFLTNGGKLYSGESLVRIDAGLPDTYRVEVIDSLFLVESGGNIFDTSGSTGAFTVVADNSISATTITGVTDSSSVASFTVASAPLLGSLATVSGFTTNTDYNTTGIVTARTSTTFEIDYVAFGTSETGSYLVTGVTVTATAHGLTIGTGVTLDTTDATDYDGGFLIYNIQTNSFDVPATFTQTEAGTWSTEGLDQTDPRVRAFNNPETADSHAIAGGFVNDNSTATGTIVNNTFTDMVFGTSGSALTEISTTERWKQIDDVNGTFEFTGLDPFDGLITFDFTVESSGGTVDFRFKWQKSTDGGSSFSDLADAVEALVAVGSDAQSVTKTFPLEMTEGDQIKPRITRNSGSSGITSTYASIYITNPA